MTQMQVTAIKGVQGVYSVHRPNQRPVEGIGVYQYRYAWSCEEDGIWRSWLPGATVPCSHIQAVLARGKEKP